MVGLKDIAKQAGVSVSTVSNVINGRKNVGEKTRKRVLEICDELGYQPNLVGRNLKTGPTNTIVFNFSDFERTFYLKILNGINDYLTSNGFDLIVCTANSSKEFMNASFTRGAIVLDKKTETEFIDRIASNRFPIVVMDRIVENDYIKNVVVGNYEVMNHFIEQIVQKGYRDFVFIGGPEVSLDHQERFAAFKDVLERYQIKFENKAYYHGDFTEKSGYQATNLMILSNQLPEIIICANDNMAIGAMKALRENGYKVPQDIAVTGFDDSHQASAYDLTTISVPRYEIGYIAAKELIEIIQGRKSNQTLKIPAKIVWRNTVK